MDIIKIICMDSKYESRGCFAMLSLLQRSEKPGVYDAFAE